MDLMQKSNWTTDAMIAAFSWGMTLGMLIVLARFWI